MKRLRQFVITGLLMSGITAPLAANCTSPNQLTRLTGEAYRHMGGVIVPAIDKYEFNSAGETVEISMRRSMIYRFAFVGLAENGANQGIIGNIIDRQGTILASNLLNGLAQKSLVFAPATNGPHYLEVSFLPGTPRCGVVLKGPQRQPSR